jgi:hypothetical protein
MVTHVIKVQSLSRAINVHAKVKQNRLDDVYQTAF